ncbi:MAG: hypothetical protein ACJ75H_07460 [Thermoanaerobaculia bacterium]
MLLLLPLAGCGGRTDESGQSGNREQAGPRGGQEAKRPVAPRGQNQRFGKHVAKAHLTLTGPLQLDADVPMACGVFPDKGLEFTFDKVGEQAPQVQVRIPDFVRDGEYPASVVIREHPESGPVREWEGSAKVNVKSRTVGGARKRTAYNGTFNGIYSGSAGKGALNGQFRRCVLTAMDQ